MSKKVETKIEDAVILDDKVESKKFNLNNIFTLDLDDNKIQLNYDKKELCNMLFAQATTLEIDMFARELYKSETAEAEVSEELVSTLIPLIDTLPYNFRGKQGLKDELNRAVSVIKTEQGLQ